MRDVGTPSWDALLPLVGVLAGYFGSIVTESRREERKAAHERALRDHDNEIALRARRDEFQRTTLLRLQEILLSLARSSAEVKRQRLRDFKVAERSGEPKEWKKVPRQGDSLKSAQDLQAESTMLCSRVQDDALRELVVDFKENCAECASGDSEEEARIGEERMLEMFIGMNDRIGELLRAIH
jgi:hypothetical protein